MISDKECFYQVNLDEIVDILLEMECGPDEETKDELQEESETFLEERRIAPEEPRANNERRIQNLSDSKFIALYEK